MKKYYLLLVTYFIIVISYAQEEVSVSSDDLKLYGTILHPDNAETVVIIISGSGNTDRDGNSLMGQTKLENNSLKMVAEQLYENDIASLRYDKRGVGKSIDISVNEKELRFESYVKDLVAWIEYLSPKYEEIVLAGHSQGALVAILAAQRAQVDKVITLAGLSNSAYKTLKEQLSNQPKFVSDQALPILEQINQGKKVDSVPPYLMSVFRPDIQEYLITFLQYDPKEEIKNLNIPVLIIQGTTDIQINVEDAKQLAESYNKAELVVINEMNHILKKAVADRNRNFETYNDPELALHPELMDSIFKFIKR